MEEYEYILDTSQLNFSGDFNEQVDEVMEYIRLTKQEVEKLQILLDDLQQAFSSVWQGCQVYGFGSIVTGLGIKTSDIDCYVQLPRWLSPPEESFVLKAKNVLKYQHWIFQQLFAVTAAKIPIVKFYHAPTERCCDVNFSSESGLHNSQLIAYFLSLDQRALHLAILVKYWSKVHNLSGCNLMPNYCVTMLVIFYLQQKNILPSVKQLQENTKENFVSNWNVAFNKLDYESDSSPSLYELLGGFFKYYFTFKYNKYLISPYLGKPVDKDCFLKPDMVPEEFSLYKTYLEKNKRFSHLNAKTFMCVQDPFEHNRNSAAAIHPKLSQKILIHFRMGADFFDICREENYLKNLLTKVTDATEKKSNKKNKNNKVQKLYKQSLIHNAKFNKISTRVIQGIEEK